MEGTVLERAERFVRNLPITKIQFRRTETDLGPIYLAYGKDGEGVYHGVWVVEEPSFILRTLTFNPGVTVAQVRASLIANADWFLKECDKRGLVRSGASFGTKY